MWNLLKQTPRNEGLTTRQTQAYEAMCRASKQVSLTSDQSLAMSSTYIYCCIVMYIYIYIYYRYYIILYAAIGAQKHLNCESELMSNEQRLCCAWAFGRLCS